MKITIEGNDGSKSVIDVDACGPIATSLFSLRTVLERVTQAIFTIHSSENKSANREAALREGALHNAAVRA